MASSDGSLSVTQIVVVLALVGVVVTVSFIGCGGCDSGAGVSGIALELERVRSSAVDELKAKGAKVELRKYPQISQDTWSVNLSGVPITDEIFDLIVQAGTVSELNLSGSGVTDAHAARINSIGIGSILRKLDLSKNEFTDAGLAELKNLSLLAELNLTGTKVTKAGIDKFQQERNSNPAIMPWARHVTIKK